MGDYVNTWNVPVNSNWSLIDQKTSGYSTLAVTGGTLTLTVAQAAYSIFSVTGALVSNQIIILPAGTTGTYIVSNSTTGAFSVTFKASGGDTGYVVPQGAWSGIFNLGGVHTVNSFASLVSQLGYTPANKAGDTFTGGVTFSSTATFNGTTTVPTVATGDVSTNAANTALVAAKIAAIAPVAPQTTIYATGSGTYTTPANAVYLRVEMVGAGSGGAGGGTGGAASAAGGNTTFGSLTAGGGAAAPAAGSSTFASVATATTGAGILSIGGGLGTAGINFNASSIAGFTSGGGLGAASVCGAGAPGAILVNTTATAAGVSAALGAGGGGGAGNPTNPAGWGGNSGAALRTILTGLSVSYSYSVGAGSAGGAAGTLGNAGSAGGNGYLMITAYFQ